MASRGQPDGPPSSVEFSVTPELAEMLDSLPGGVLWMDVTGKIVWANAEALRFIRVGAATNGVRGQRTRDWWPSVVYEDGSPCYPEDYVSHKTLATGQPQGPVTLGARMADGELAWAVVRAVPTKDCDGNIDGLVTTFLDITEQKRAETRYRALVENSPDFITILDREGRIQFINRIHPNYGREQVIGQSAERFMEPEAIERFHAALESVFERGENARYEFEGAGSEGHGTSWYQADLFPLREGDTITAAMMRASDISDVKQAAQEQLEFVGRARDAQKLESLGVLAGGIAHDFNNILSGVLGNAGLARLELPAGSTIEEYLADIEIAARRAGELCNQLLAYSGRGAFIVRSLDLAALVRETSKLIELSVSKKTELKYQLADQKIRIDADASQIRQVIMNLLINASEALGNEAGVVSISTYLEVVETERTSVGGRPLKPGRYGVLQVQDEGDGMDKETLQRMFDPFFTTKKTGRGLGMAAVLGIVHGHRGAIEVHSRRGRGSTVRILLPENQGKTMSAEEPQVEEVEKDKGIVLVVDDEAAVRRVAERSLRHFGFEPLMASDGVQAFELFREHAEDIRAVILDLTMPQLSGEETMNLLRSIRPDLPIVLSSGYSSDVVEESLSGPTVFLQKPYAPAELVRVLKRALRQTDQA